MRALRAWISPARAVDLFIVSNLGFLGIDILIAHAVNAFRRSEEWIPIYFSLGATLICLVGLFSPRLARVPAIAAGLGAILVGSAGMIYHLESAFFAERTLRSLVYAAPFIAPLAYVGVGLLLILTRLEPRDSREYPEWILILALGGFVGNFGLALADHAQNAFFFSTEWISVIAAAFAVSFLTMTLVWPADRMLERIAALVIAAQVVVGVIGFVLHNLANLAHPGASFADKIIFGAPAFAPLLFADLAVLAGIGLWARFSGR